MSRSYRYDPDGGEQPRQSWERQNVADCLGDIWPEENAPARPKRRRRREKASSCEAATPERAMEMMRDRIDTVLSTLVDRRIFPPHEKEDYTQILNIHICRMLPFYEQGRTGWNEREASIRRYLNVLVDSAVADIVRHCMANKSQILATAVPVQEADDDDEDEDGHSVSMPYSRNPYRNPRRNMEALWIRMDIEVLMEMLTEEERVTLDLRIQGFTYPEIANKLNSRLSLGVDRFHVMNVTMEGVRRAALKCGFVPGSGFGGQRK